MPKHVLLLEDEDHSRRSLAHLLRTEGHHVVVATNALEAQAAVGTQPPEVAVVDIELPGLRGDEWACYLKEMSPTTRIVFVSGRPGLTGMDRFGPNATFLHKPFAPADLLNAIEQPAARQPVQ